MVYFVVVIVAAMIVLWMYDKIKFKTQRIGKYYATRVIGKSLELSHEPLWLYRNTKEEFFQIRSKAYSEVCGKLLSGEYPKIELIHSKSFWIDYEREGWNVTSIPSSSWMRIQAAYYFKLNLNNSTNSKSWMAIGNKTIYSAYIPVDEFIAKYSGR